MNGTMTASTSGNRPTANPAIVDEWQAALVDLLSQLAQCSSLIQEDCFHDRLYSAICEFSRHHHPLALAALSQSLGAIQKCLRLAVPDSQQMHDEDQVDGRLALFALRLYCLRERLLEQAGSTAPVLPADGWPMDLVRSIIHHSVSGHVNSMSSLYPESHLILGVLEYASSSCLFRHQVALNSLDSAMLRACLHHNNVNIVRQACLLVLELIRPVSSADRPSLSPLLIPLLSIIPQPHTHLHAVHRGLAAVELASTLVESNIALVDDERQLLSPLATSPNHLIRRKWLGLARFPASLTGMDHVSIFNSLVSHGWISDAVNLIRDLPEATLVVPFAQRILALDPDSTSAVLAAVAQWVLHAEPRLADPVQHWLAGAIGTDPSVRWPYHTLAKALSQTKSSLESTQRLFVTICRALVEYRRTSGMLASACLP
ncbi:hypothetical protein BCR44DRAFT_1271251 [Catenaria anguillulae PL171]|uniref:Uncharacterized protein n=1 Tax=Catenaria anguillulae PL171 TaxID=765915 RepID=A0A1Y2HXD8_9FUNG|nr:hypothetical protein BCR44DRAFT_1271251 [Catenaria anguillulae PL171]